MHGSSAPRGTAPVRADPVRWYTSPTPGGCLVHPSRPARRRLTRSGCSAFAVHAGRRVLVPERRGWRCSPFNWRSSAAPRDRPGTTADLALLRELGADEVVLELITSPYLRHPESVAGTALPAGPIVHPNGRSSCSQQRTPPHVRRPTVILRLRASAGVRPAGRLSRRPPVPDLPSSSPLELGRLDPR